MDINIHVFVCKHIMIFHTCYWHAAILYNREGGMQILCYTDTCVNMVHMPNRYYDDSVANKETFSQMENTKSGNFLIYFFFPSWMQLSSPLAMPFTTQTQSWSSVFRLEWLAICVSLNMLSQIPLPALTEPPQLHVNNTRENLPLITEKDAVFFLTTDSLCCWQRNT